MPIKIPAVFLELVTLPEQLSSLFVAAGRCRVNLSRAPDPGSSLRGFWRSCCLLDPGTACG